MHSFKLSVDADQDIYDILDYTLDKWGMDQAVNYTDEIDQGREKIQHDPYLLGSKSQEILSKGCRSYKVNHHYFFYRVNEKESTIEIARILHETADFPRHVSDKHFPK